jgi:hypothetical protein
MKKRLKKDIVIKAGTIFDTAPKKTTRHGNDHFNCVVGLTNDSAGFFNYCIDEDDKELTEWFEDVE